MNKLGFGLARIYLYQCMVPPEPGFFWAYPMPTYQIFKGAVISVPRTSPPNAMPMKREEAPLLEPTMLSRLDISMPKV